ncbi:SoxR reducing system RseC family protein [Caldisalinibacter kiritimatiensis]|uniref:Sigma factor RpoE regulatory protein RseC n=1 Tax=Caldisalinibacter kiritimatiensis TaxID=1304284 RepID=R1CEC9_9FIRM|nr:SoxR reducing system RseC family protein [Caldisalinibacter kiritimatiensis]EOD00650.1 hypothetical protein L21TH_1251 [Caldisalinibacter kiritimatiensis]
MEQVGFVSKVEGNKATVIVRRVTSCGDSCSTCSGSCSVPGLTVDIDNTIGAKKGDYVEVRTRTKTILKSAFLVYIIPLVLMVVGIALGIYVFKGLGFDNYESIGLLTGLVALGISYVILRIVDNKIKRNNSIDFEMVRILD